MPADATIVRTSRSARFSRTNYAPGIAMPKHGHQPASFSMVLSGAYEEVVGRDCRWVQPPFVIFHPPGEEHAVRFGSVRTNILRAEISHPSLNYIQALGGLDLVTPRIVINATSAAIAARAAMAFASTDGVSELELESCLYEMCGLLTTRPERTNGKLAVAATDYLKAHYHTSVALSDVAKAIGCHPASLARSFRERHDCTVGDYVRKLRLDKAGELLLKTNLTLTEIAAELEFSDQAHFTRSFKAAYRILPSQFRRNFHRG